MSRERDFVTSIVDRIVAEADRCDVPVERVFGAIKIAFENKRKCIDLARVQGTDGFDLRQFYDPRLIADSAINCKCYSLGVWKGVIEPEKIVYSGNRTIVFWNDGTKTIVKLGKGQEFDEYLGFVAAYAKKMFGNTSRLKKLIAKISFYDKSKERREAKKLKKAEKEKANKSDEAEN